MARKKLTPKVKGTYTILEAWMMFQTHLKTKQVTQGTLDYYQRIYKKIDFFYHEEAPIEVITNEAMLVDYIEYLALTGNQQTINNYLRGLRAFGNYCVEEGILESFHCPVHEVAPEVKDCYTDDELRALLRKPNPKNFAECRDYTIIVLLLSTGARANTIRNIKVNDVDLQEGYINFNTTKAHKVVRLGLPPKCVSALKTFIKNWLPDDCEYLFTNCYGNQFSSRGLNDTIADYNRAHGVMKTSLHLFRHTFAKNWIVNGGDLISLAAVLTHSELDMVKRYANLYNSDTKEKQLSYSTLQLIKTNDEKIKRRM